MCPHGLRRILLLAFSLVFSVAAAPKDPPPAPEGGGGFYSIVAGQGQTVQPGSPFGVAVRLTGTLGVAGVEVKLLRVLSGGPSIACEAALTDTSGLAVLSCQAGFTPFRTQVLITVGDSFGRVAPDFSITIQPPFLVEGFTKRYAVHSLVYYGETLSIHSAITREKQMKKWRRAWKIRLIESENPTWSDLYESLI